MKSTEKISESQTGLRDVYAARSLSQIPRLLGLQDRNPLSPTYGCFHRDYWLDRTSDFPDAVRQFGVQPLAIAYAHDFPNNPYRGKAKVLDWTIAGMEYWTRLQHRSGAFDEFYPYEQGWVGPTAFTAYTVADAYQRVASEIPQAAAQKILDALHRAAKFVAAGEREEDHLANHYAMACLAVLKVHRLVQDPALLKAFDRLWAGFLTFHHPEGWSREYDGIDPGYLSATVSFLGKVYQMKPLPEILRVVRESVETCSYFLYPNGFYAGSTGSRNTLHFYSHGFEVFGREIPLAAALAEKGLEALNEGKLVPPEIMSDRYVFYRVPEYLQSYLDHAPRPSSLPELPHERASFQRWLPQAGIWVKKTDDRYAVCNLAKGGVIKIFSADGKPLLNDAGVLGQLRDGRLVTTQWIDPAFEIRQDEDGWEISGAMHEVPTAKLFTPVKLIVFRLVLLALGWNAVWANALKGWSRRTLILKCRRAPLAFHRTVTFKNGAVTLRDEVKFLEGSAAVTRLHFGDEFYVRYVPQSRYFQAQELEFSATVASSEQLERLNKERVLIRETSA